MKDQKKPKKSVDEQAKVDLDRWDNMPAANPFYRGKTPVEVARMLLKPLKGK